MGRRRTKNVKLCKAKKKDHLLKRGDFEILDEAICPLQGQKCRAHKMRIKDIVTGINSGDENKEITATHAARKILSRERDPPIDILMNAKVVPKLVEFLSRVTNPDLQFESAWALSNIASGTSDQTKAVVNAGAVAGFISLLASPYPVVARQAVWALGNIAGDGPELRDHVIEQGIIKPLLGLIKPDTPATFLRDVTWTLCNLCRNENHPPSVPAVRQLLPALAHLIQNTDIDILADACWAIFFLTDGPNERIQEVVDAGVVPRLVALLGHPQAAVITPNLRTIGNIVTGSDTQTDSVLAAGACPLLAKLLEHSTNDTVKEAARTVSNISTRFLIHIVVTETVAFVLGSDLAPSTSQGGNFEFSRTSQAPEGGFSI